MKDLVSIFFVLFLSATATIGQTKQSAFHDVKKVELIVTGMSCQKGCADGIDKQLNTTYGIVKSHTSFEKSKSSITFDPDLISVNEIIALIKKRGYEVRMK